MQSEILKILFIINPILEKRRGLKVIQLISDSLDPVLFEPSIVYSEYPGHARDLARAGLDIYQVIVAGGGDGTVNEIGSQLIHSKTILGILPMGSGKGLARSLGIPLDIRKALQTLNELKIMKIDTGLANQFRFINIAGIGFDAAVAHAYAQKSGRGFFTYAFQSARSLFHFKSFPVRIKTGQMDITTSTFLLSFANSNQWGYGALISPHSNTADGLLDLCLLKNFPRILSPLLVIKLFNGTIHKSGFIEILPIKQAEIGGHESYIGHIDGEPVEFAAPVKVKVDPASLNVITGRQPIRAHP
jgi:YegS/Rv2252/BmrU family lipid kinase